MLLNVLGDCDGSHVQMPIGQCHAHLSITTQIKGSSCLLSNFETLLCVLKLLPITVTLWVSTVLHTKEIQTACC